MGDVDLNINFFNTSCCLSSSMWINSKNSKKFGSRFWQWSTDSGGGTSPPALTPSSNSSKLEEIKIWGLGG